MMLFNLLYFNIFWCSLAVLCVSVKCTTGIPSRDKHLQEELNEFEISIQRLLGHNGSSKTGSQQTRIVDTLSGSKNMDVQVQRDRKFEGRLTGSRRAIPASLDMAYQPQKQVQNGHRKIVLEQDDESEKTQEKKKTAGRIHTPLDISGDEDHESEDEKSYSTEEKIENNPVKYDKNKIEDNSKKDFEETSGKEGHESEEEKNYSTDGKIENNPVKYGKNNSKKDFEEDSSGNEDHESEEGLKEYSTEEKIENKPVKYGKNNSKNNSKKDFMHESRRKNSKTVNEVVIPNAIDLAFNPNSSQNTRPTRPPTAKPTTLYWPPMTLQSNPTANQICSSAIDLGFLVEASKSVARTGTGNYRRLINFIKHVVLRFSIGPTATRIGVISYANRPISLIGFNDGENILDVLKFLNLPCHHCLNAQTGLALSFAHSFLYGCSCSLRPRVLVVITDGRSSDGVHIPSRILKQKGVKIIAVGVGRYFNIHQLNVIASRPVQDNVFTGDFSKIHYVTNELVRQICKVTDGSMAYPSSSSPCSCP